MKTSMIQLVLAVSVVLAMVSCQSTTGSASSAAVACGKCRTVWVNAGASGGRGNPVVLKSTGTMECPDCRNTATAMLKGLTTTTHTCKSCGETPFHCKSM